MRSLLLALLLLAAPAGATELKLASWNIAWLTLRPASDPALPRDVQPRAAEDLTLLAGYAKRLDADIVALQEIDGPEVAARIFPAAEYHLVFADEADIQRTGFAIRRSLTVKRNPDLAALDLYPAARFSLRRGTDITVEAAGHKLRLLSIHLKSGCHDVPLESAFTECDAVTQQARILAEWVAARRRDGIGFGILGDFNRGMVTHNDSFLNILTAAAPITRATEGLGDPCWSAGRGARRFIDHILLGGPAREWFLDKSLRVMVYAERERSYRARLSDHCPLSVMLKLPG